jgi:hypothetical protein
MEQLVSPFDSQPDASRKLASLLAVPILKVFHCDHEINQEDVNMHFSVTLHQHLHHVYSKVPMFNPAPTA